MIGIKTNLEALSGQNNLKKTQLSLSQAIGRLSSGLRINSAKDDAAGLAIANRMEANIRAGTTAQRNINDGIGLMQTAEGGLDEINHMLQRARQLTVQATTQTLSDSDRAAINGEFVQLREEIDRIAASTEIFGQHPLARHRDNPPEPPKLGEALPVTEKFPVKGGSVSFTSGIVSLAYIPKGATNVRLEIDDRGANDDIQVFTVSGKHLVGTPIGTPTDPNPTWYANGVREDNVKNTVLTESNGFAPDAVYDDTKLLQGEKSDPNAPFEQTIEGATYKYSGDGNKQSNGSDRMEYLEINEIKEDLILLVTGRGAFIAKMSWDFMPELEMVTPPPNPPPYSENVDIVVSAHFDDDLHKLTIEATPSDSKSLGIDETALDPYELALLAFEQLDFALEKVNTYRGYYGAMTNRFESAINNIATQNVNLHAAQSRIQDADYAAEISAMTKAQILQQAGSHVLSISNQSAEGLLSLLQA